MLDEDRLFSDEEFERLAVDALDSLLVLHGERFLLGLPGCFASRLTLRVQLVLVGVVVGPTALAVAGPAVRPAPTRLAAVDGELGLGRHNTAAGAGSRIARH
jgi:hypothetical protein